MEPTSTGTILGVTAGFLVMFLIACAIGGLITGALARLVLPGPDPDELAGDAGLWRRRLGARRHRRHDPAPAKPVRLDPEHCLRGRTDLVLPAAQVIGCQPAAAIAPIATRLMRASRTITRRRSVLAGAPRDRVRLGVVGRR